MKFRVFIGTSTIISLMLAGMLLYRQSDSENKSGIGWELVYDQGNLKMLYISPERCGDEKFVAGVLYDVLGNPFENELPLVDVYIFDDPRHTPISLPILNARFMEDEFPFNNDQLRHFRAMYNFNQWEGNRFYFVDLIDADASPPTFKLRPAQVYPQPYPEMRAGI
jgi:hypothetical protein